MRKKYGFLAEREGNRKFKEFPFSNYTIPIRQYLQSLEFDMPKIINLTYNGEAVTIESEWIEGIDFLHLQANEELTLDDFYKWGVYMGKLHNIKTNEGLCVASHDLQFGNVIRTDDGKVMLCDWTKVYLTDFPEEEIIRYIVSPYDFKREHKDSFMKGYLTQRGITLDDVIQKFLNANWDNYQDLYCNGVLLRRGPRSNKRLKFLPKDMTGLKVVDIGCSCGMLAREAKRLGAKYVLAIDNQHHTTHNLIDLVSIVSYAEGLHIDFKAEDASKSLSIKDNSFDVIFFCAVSGHIGVENERFAYLQMLRTKCKIMYFESNLGGKEEPHRKLLEKAGFKDIECLGESGDPDRNENSHYTMFKCSGDL